MTTTLLPVPKARFFDASGAPLAGGKVYTYVAGTTTPKATYTDAGGGTPNANPAILDAAGEANIWIRGNYKIVLKNSADVTQWTVDNVSGASEVSVQWLTVTGTDTLIATPQSAVTSYQAQQIFLFYAENTNTTAVTINISGLGAKSITKNGSVALVAGDIVANAIQQINYDGTRFQLQTVPAGTYLNKADGGTVSGNVSFTGTAAFSGITNTGLKISDTGGDNTVTIGPAINYTGNRTVGLLTDANTVLGGNNLGAIYSSVAGFLPSGVTGSSTTGAVTISAGQLTDSTFSKTMSGAGFSWAVSNGNAANGYQGGATLPNSSTIHFYVIALATDTTWTASFASTSLTPTLPGSYTLYRRAFSIPTNSSGALIPGSAVEVCGGGLVYYLTTEVLDVNVSNLSTSRTLYALTVPSGIKVEPFFRFAGTTNPSAILITSPEQSDVAPGTASTVPLQDGWNDTGQLYARAKNGFVVTDTSGRIGARSSNASTVFYLVTFGWCDFRRS